MLKKLAISITALAFLTAPVFADDLGPTQNASSVNGTTDVLSVLQPANPNPLQSTTGVSGSDNSSGTGLSALQPAGTKSDTASLLVGSADGEPQTPAPTNSSNFNDVLLGIAGVAFLITGIIIFRTSKRLEAMQTSQPEESVEAKADTTLEVSEEEEHSTDDTEDEPKPAEAKS